MIVVVVVVVVVGGGGGVAVAVAVAVAVESYYFFNNKYCWLPSTASPPSRLRAVTLSNNSIYKIQAKPRRCSGDLLLL